MTTMDQLFNAGKKEELRSLSKVPPTLSIEGPTNNIGVLSFEAVTLTTFNAGKAMPSRSRWTDKTLRFEATPASLAYVRRHWPNVIVLKPAVKRQEPVQETVQPVEGQIYWTPRLKPFAHQSEALAQIAPLEAGGYLMDMGTGKTATCILDAAYHFSRGEIDRAVVVAPNGVHEQWIDQALPVHWPLSLPCVRWAIRTDDKFTRKGEVIKRRPDWIKDGVTREMKWLAVNVENIKVRMEKVGPTQAKRWALEGLSAEVEAFLKGGKAMLIWDESHKPGKNPQARATIAMKKLRRSALFRRALTGTPVAKGLEDYYGQFLFLDPSIIGVHSMEGFKNQFCIMGGFQGEEIQGYRNTDEFHRRIAPYVFRVEKSEVLDLPPKLYDEWVVEPSPEQRRIYRELKNDLLTELSDGSQVSAEHVMVRMLRLQQVACGYLPREDGTLEEIEQNRLPFLLERLEQVPDRTVIWCRFTEDVERVSRELGDECIKYYGANKKDRPDDKREWLLPGSKKRFFVGNAAAGGTGLDWIIGNGPVSTVIYYSNSFNSIDRWQSEDRTHRIGTKGTVNYYDMICRGLGIDRAILRNLREKRDISGMSLAELKELAAQL